MSRSLAAAALLLALWPATARALDPARPLDLYALRAWREGLPQYLVRAVAQTRDGYIWLGTMEGAVRFNGLQFEVFDHRNAPAITDQRIRALAEDGNGTLWIATFGGGIVLERNGRFEPLRGLRNPSINALAASRDGSMWIATTDALLHWRRGVLHEYPHDRRNDIAAIAEDARGVLWLGTARGIERFDGHTFTPVDVGEPVSVTSILAAHDGTIWIGGGSDRIHRIASGGATHDVIRTGFPTAYVHAIFEDRHGVVWIGTSPGGLARWRNRAFERIDKSGGLPSSSVRSIEEDAEGNLWAGTDGGLARLADLKFVTYTARHGLSDDAIRVVTESRDGSLWIGTYGGGINRLRDGRITTYGESSTLFVRTMCEDAGGVLWIGSDRGVATLRDGAIHMLGPAQKIDAVQVLRDGTVLVSTPAGLQAMRGGALVPFVEGERAGNARAILESRDGSIWLATYDGVVQLRDRRVVRRITARDGLAGNMTFALLEEGNGDLWIGTHDGLSRVRGNAVQSLTVREGLPNGVVFQILDDRRGHFWLTSNHGLARVERREIDDVFAHRAARIHALTFGKSDGLGDDECNGATQPAGVTLRSGLLAIPTAGGLTLVDPANLHVNHQPPSVVLREVLVDGKPADAAKLARLPWRSSRYELHYDGLSYVLPELVHFQYRMDGFDDAWIDAGTRRSAFYNSLPPGRHTFHVIAFNNDGVPNVGDAAIAFELEAPPWLRWWAFALYAIVAILLALLAVRMTQRVVRRRTEALEAKIRERTIDLAAAEARAVQANRAKSVFLANMSHELRTPLNAVLGSAQLMERSRTLARDERDRLAVIRRAGEHLLGLINDVLSISKIEAGKLAISSAPFDPRAMLDSVAELIRVRTEAAGLQFLVDVDPHLPHAVSGDEGKLRQVLINLLGNAVKFTHSGSIALRASWSGGRATFEVADTGAGIGEHELATLFEAFVQTATGVQSKEGTGLGLTISRELVRLMGGDIEVESAPGIGTTFRFDVALPAAARLAPRDERRVIGLAPGEARRRIGIVDDVAENRALLRQLLATAGFDVADAANGEEAIALWRDWRPDLLFMDQRMAGIGGAEATRRIRAEEAESGRARTSIVALTASAFEHERAAILANGADDFVMKPYTESVIFDTIARHLGVRYAYEEPRGQRVLLVDDEAITRAIASELLTTLGLEVTEAHDGVEALELLDAHSFDAVVLDLEMPRLDGRETVKRIRARERLRNLPVIAVTSHDRDQAFVEGMTDYVAKPIDERQVVAVLGRYVRLSAIAAGK
jgi:signal transduction histidine kinase/CheY-like chemotaxis protein/ligand-binding sensor domain-containing protein